MITPTVVNIIVSMKREKEIKDRVKEKERSGRVNLLTNKQL
jgi:hypothetical protein